jgi:hypothetical protein
MALSSGKIIATFFDKALKELEEQDAMSKLVEVDSISMDTMQNTSDQYWRNVEQQAPVIVGRDLTGLATDVIEQVYPLTVSAPRNDFFELNVSQLRDEGFMDRRAKAAAKKLSSDLNKQIADTVAAQGSLYYETGTVDFDFVAEADAILDERQAYRDDGASFFLNSRTNQAMAGNLASRTLYPSNRSEEAYKKNMVGENVAGFDMYRASFAGNVAAALNATTTTVSADVVDVPAGQHTVGGTLVNLDYRFGTIPFTAVTNFQVGDVITFAGVNSLGVMDKSDTGELMTFKIIAIDTLNVTVYPKPIAADQAAITDAEAAYANISTSIDSGDVISKVNVAGGKVNSFWANDSICVVNGREPLELLGEFSGMKVERETMSNGVDLYIAYDAQLSTLNAQIRLFTRYGVVNKDPSRNGNAIYAP